MRWRTMRIDAKDLSKLAVIMRCKVDGVWSILTNTHGVYFKKWVETSTLLDGVIANLRAHTRPEIGSSKKMMEGFDTSSTAIESLSDWNVG